MELKSNSVNHVRLFRSIWFLIVLAFCLAMVPMIISFYPFHPVDFLGTEFMPIEVKAGEIVKYKMLVEKHTTLTPTITRFLVSTDDTANQIQIGTTTPGSQRITDKHKWITVEIPRWVEPGRYFIRSVASYEYFGFRKVEVDYNTPCFNVISERNIKAHTVTTDHLTAGKVRADSVEARRIEAERVKAKKIEEMK
jgi:hypothetical protein